MVFTLIILVAIGFIGFFHYVQGLFSATISALLTVLAAVLAVSYHEPIVHKLLAGKVADSAYGMVLLILFPLIYLVLRQLFDRLVPGNVRFPVLMDKIGAGVMGAVAGLFAAGVVAVAAQTLPFGPSIAGYSRLPLATRTNIAIPTGGQTREADIIDELKLDSIRETQRSQGMILPVDDLLVGTVAYLSDHGSLAGSVAFRDVHPDYLQELFGQRLSLQIGAKRTMLEGQAKVEGVWRLDSIAMADAEPSWVRPKDFSIKPRYTPDPDHCLVVVRTVLEADAADDDRLVRFTPTSVRLAAKRTYFHPIGTIEGGNLLLVSRPDDFIFVPAGKAVDWAFDVPSAVFFPLTFSGTSVPLNDNVFIEVKRMARISLSGQEAGFRVPASPDVQVLRKGGVKTSPGAAR